MLQIIDKHVVAELLCPIRLQEYGVRIFTTILTKSALKKAIKKEQILVNGVIGTTATFIKEGDCIQLKAQTETASQKRLVLDLTTVYEDDYLAIILKPAGILVSGNSFKTVANALSQNIKPSNALDAVRPVPVHRLDYPTTGLLLVGKTSKSIMLLNLLFKEKQIKKTYYAITMGEMKDNGRVVLPIDSKEAVSEYYKIQSVNSQRFGALNLVKLNPKTGRRHQLRKHLLALGNPILGDATYSMDNLILKGKGLYLHASMLEFIHPITKEYLVIESKLPLKFMKLFANKKK